MGKNAVSQDAHPAERLLLPHQAGEPLPFPIAEDEFPVHRPGETMVIGDGMTF